MRFRDMRFRVMRFRAPSAAPPGGVMAGGGVPAMTAVPPISPFPPLVGGGQWGIGHPLVESQRAGVDYLIRIAREQAAARDGTPEAYRHI
jgi:hypothetical protein